MPEALTTHPQNYPHNPPVDKMVPVADGQSYPPKDYAKWGELVYHGLNIASKNMARTK